MMDSRVLPQGTVRRADTPCMSSNGAAPFGVAPQRTPVEFDASTGGLRIGPYERRVEDPAEPGSVYSAYLSLLYAVRGAKPGERLALREADLEALLLIVGDDPATIEERLVGLMGCTAEEASVLGRLLLRHRKVTATLGVAAGLTLGAAGVVSWVADDPAPVVAPLASAPVEDPAPIRGVAEAGPAVGPVAPAPVPVGPVAVVQPETTPVVVAAAEPVVAAPVAEAPAPVAPAPAAAEAPPPAAPAEPVAPGAPPVVVGPVAAEVVESEPAYALPTYAEPVMDAPPPPIEIELPDFDIGEPAIIEVPFEEIGGVVDSDDDLPIEPGLSEDEAPVIDAVPPAEEISGTSGS